MQTSDNNRPRLAPVALPWAVSTDVSRISVTWHEQDACVIELDAYFGLSERLDRRVRITFRSTGRCDCHYRQKDGELREKFEFSEVSRPGKSAEEFIKSQNDYWMAWKRDGLCPDSGIYFVTEYSQELPTRYQRFLISGVDCYIEVWAERFDWSELYELDGSECLTVSADGRMIL